MRAWFVLELRCRRHVDRRVERLRGTVRPHQHDCDARELGRYLVTVLRLAHFLLLKTKRTRGVHTGILVARMIPNSDQRSDIARYRDVDFDLVLLAVKPSYVGPAEVSAQQPCREP